MNELLSLFLGPRRVWGSKDIFGCVKPFDSLEFDIELSEDVSLGFRLGGTNHKGDNVKGLSYFVQPVFDFSAIETPAQRAHFTDITNASVYNVSLSGLVSIGANATYPDGDGIDLSGIVGGIVDNVFLNLGIRSTERLDILYRLNANIDIVSFSNLEFAIMFYLPEEAEHGEELFLTLYYVGSEDVLYIDLSELSKLRRKLPMLSIISDLPKLKLEDVGIRNLLSGMGDADNAAYAEYYNALGEAIALEAEDSMDMLDLIGAVISEIIIGRENNEDPAESIKVLVSSQLLTVLLQFLGMNMTAPEVNAYVKIQLYRAMGDYVQIHLGILDSGNSEIEAIELNLNLIKNLRVKVGRDVLVIGHKVEEFKNILHWAESLKVAVASEGYISLAPDGTEVYENESLNSIIERLYSGSDPTSFMGQLIKSLAIRFNLGEFSVNLGYSIRGNISISNIIKSDLEIVIYDRDAVVATNGFLTDISGEEVRYAIIIAIYLIDNEAYVDLSHFGLPKIALTDVEGTLNNIYAMQWDKNYLEATALKEQLMKEMMQEVMQSTDKTKAMAWDKHLSNTSDSKEIEYLNSIYNNNYNMLVQRIRDLKGDQQYEPNPGEREAFAKRAKSMSWDALCGDTDRRKSIYWDNYYSAINEVMDNLALRIEEIEDLLSENPTGDERMRLENELNEKRQEFAEISAEQELAYEAIRGIEELYPNIERYKKQSLAWDRLLIYLGDNVPCNKHTGETIIDYKTGKPRLTIAHPDDEIKALSWKAYGKRSEKDAAVWKDMYAAADEQTRQEMDGVYQSVLDEIYAKIVEIMPQNARNNAIANLENFWYRNFRSEYPNETDQQIRDRVRAYLELYPELREEALKNEAKSRFSNHYTYEEAQMMALHVYRSSNGANNLAPQNSREFAEILIPDRDYILNASYDNPAAVALQMWFGNQRLTINVTSDVMNNLLRIMDINLPVSIRDTYLSVNLGENFGIDLATGADVLLLEMNIGRFSFGVMDEDMHKIEVPFKSDYAEGTASGVPQAIYVKIEGSFFLKNNPTYENQNLITFTPLLQEFLTVSAFDKKELRISLKK